MLVLSINTHSTFSKFTVYNIYIHMAPHISICVTTIMLLLATMCASQDPNFICSRATYYGSPDCYGTPSGACGYGEFGRTVNEGYVAAASRLYKDGTGCGACYQVKCTRAGCSAEGVKVVVTDYGEGDRTDFILSPRAYARLGPNELFAYGVVEMEYRRIPCEYTAGYNLMLKVHEHSRYPHYLALIPIYQGGVSDVTGVEVWVEECKEWKGLRRAFGAVWDMPSPPLGALTLRLQVNQKWVNAANAIPSDWKSGVAYDSTFQLT